MGEETRGGEEEEDGPAGLLGRMDLILEKIYPLSLSSAVKKKIRNKKKSPHSVTEKRKIFQKIFFFCLFLLNNCIYLYTAVLYCTALCVCLGTRRSGEC
jgi:hypothetical protein